jgi:hypothetical protein
MADGPGSRPGVDRSRWLPRPAAVCRAAEERWRLHQSGRGLVGLEVTVPDYVYEVRVRRVSRDRALVVEAVRNRPASYANRVSPAQPAIRRLAHQHGAVRLRSGKRVHGQRDGVDVAVGRDRNPWIGGARVVAAIGRVPARAAAEPGRADRPGQTAIVGEGAEHTAGGRGRNSVLYPGRDQVLGVLAIGSQHRLDDAAAVDPTSERAPFTSVGERAWTSDEHGR